MSRFDTVIDRRKSDSTKFNKYLDQDILPLWVADMDFAAPPLVLEALRERVDHGVFGYTEPAEALVEEIQHRLRRLYQWDVEAEAIVFLPGVVPGLNLAARAFAAPGEGVMTVTPIYTPFMDAAGFAGRNTIKVPADAIDGRWMLPWAGLERAADEARVFLFCNPWNPVGRVLGHSEVERVVDLCIANDLVLVSDEIHCDLVFDGRTHVPAATISPSAREVTVTLLAPSKTFNLAGFGGSFAVIQNEALRDRFSAEMRGIVPNVNIMAYTSMLSAYRDCEDWYRELIGYLEGNRDYLAAALAPLPGISMNQVEGTYLAWLDVSSLALNDPPGFFEQGGLGMSEGARYDDERFMRLNFGCPRSVLESAVTRFHRLIGGN